MESAGIEGQLQGHEKEKNFYEFHGVQLYGMNFPANADLIKSLSHKLDKSEFDAGEYFEILVNEETESFEVVSKRDLKAFQDVFLIDHAFSFRYPELRKALMENSHLKERLSSMLTFSDTKRAHPAYPKTTKQNPNIPISEFDNQEIEDPSTLDIPETAVGLSLWGNNISEFDKLKLVLDKLPNLKVLWLNQNPIAEDLPKLIQWVEKYYPHIQIVNSQFTLHVDFWGIRFANMYPNLEGFEDVKVEELRHLDLSSRNIFHLKDFSLFTEFKKLKSVNIKSHDLTSYLETNKLFDFMKSIPKLKNIDCDDELAVVLWDLYDNKKIQDICPTLVTINGYDLLEGKPKEEEADLQSILRNVWKINGTYRLATSEKLDETNVWYILDEFGSAIQRSHEANSAVKPFLYAPNNKLDESVISYSLLWLTKDVKQGDRITQDYVGDGIKDENSLAKMKVWCDLPNDTFLEAYNRRKERLEKAALKAKEYKPEEKKVSEEKVVLKTPIKVASDYELVINRLTSPNYQIVKGVEEADYVYLITSLGDNTEFLKGKYFNQFPNEVSICMKHNLAKTINEGAGEVKWLQTTYDLNTELNEFIGCFQTREKLHYDNHWIIKAPNLARSLDMVITNNLDTVIRLTETGPRLAQKYIHKPLTLKNKKIDHRFIVIVKSIEPLEVFIYKTFMTRTANFRFTLDPRSVDNYETHFTIMTYSGRRQDEISPEWFLEAFDEEHKKDGVTWNDAYGKVKEMVREIFTTIARTRPEMHNKYSRAIYGMDVMFDATYQPKLLELTFAPDVKRPSTLSPSFFNDIFDCFFFGEERNMDRVF